MRKVLLALGVFAMLFGLVLHAVSQMSVQEQLPYETWLNVNDTEANPPVGNLSVEGNLTSGDKFRLWFSLQPSQSQVFPNSLGIKMNLTNPNGNTASYIVHVDIDEEGKIRTLDPYPEDIANYTGTYRVDGQSLGVVLIRLLVIQKSLFVEPELKYPYEALLPVGIVVFLVGVGLILWGAMSSKRKRPLRKKR